MNRIIASISLILTLAACGGGGGGGSAADSNTPIQAAVVVSRTYTNSNLITTMASGDLNNDGLEDVVTGGLVYDGTHTAYIQVFYQNANGTLTEKTLDVLPSRTYTGSNKIFIADFDNDGWNDIILPGFDDAAYAPLANTVIFWNNHGTFQRQDLTDRVEAHGACYFDINRDGYLDMLISGRNGGLYINNHNRTFTIDQTAMPNDFWDTCSVAPNADGSISIIMGDSGLVVGSKSAIITFDSNLRELSRVGITAPWRGSVEFDLINSEAVDVNQDGFVDFIAVYNDLLYGVPGAKQVFLNNGHGVFTPLAPFETVANNTIYSKVFVDQGRTSVWFGAINGDNQLFQFSNGSATLYKQSVLDQLAASLGTRQGDWRTGHGIVYRNLKTNAVYMLQYINNNYYTVPL